MKKDLKKQNAFTLAEGATHVGISHNIGGTFHRFVESFTHVGIFNNTRRVGFTLAEVLITLGIIGIVSAMTIPTLIKNYEKQQILSKLKKAYATLNHVVKARMLDTELIPKNNDRTAIEYFEEYIKPYIKIASIDPERDNSNGFEYISDLNGTCIDHINRPYRDMVTFSTPEGIRYSLDRHDTLVYVDLNGKKGPNRLGRDYFVFRIDNLKNTVIPGRYNNITWLSCTTEYAYGGEDCSTQIIINGWKFPDNYPWKEVFAADTGCQR